MKLFIETYSVGLSLLKLLVKLQLSLFGWGVPKLALYLLDLTLVIFYSFSALIIYSRLKYCISYSRPLIRWLFQMYWFLLMVFGVAQMVKRLPAMLETRVWSLGWEDPLEKEMATHASTLAWKTPWTVAWGVWYPTVHILNESPYTLCYINCVILKEYMTLIQLICVYLDIMLTSTPSRVYITQI